MGDLLFLERIARPDWVKYITDRFRRTKKKISPALANAIAGTMEDHPYSVQMLANATWQRTTGTATVTALEEGFGI